MASMRNVFRGVRSGASPWRLHAVPPAVLLPFALAVGAVVFIAYETTMQSPTTRHAAAPRQHVRHTRVSGGHSRTGGMRAGSSSTVRSGQGGSPSRLPEARISMRPSVAPAVYGHGAGSVGPQGAQGAAGPRGPKGPPGA